jgi:Protein of unknown function (DUF1549)/Protein of unknown function (DUF1553)/EF hand
MRTSGTQFVTAFAVLGGLLASWAAAAEQPEKPGKPSERKIAAEVDRLLDAAVTTSGGKLAPRTGDADFLRRVSLDLSGRIPSPRDLTLFGLEPASEKRSKVIDRLLDSDAFARNWARYWRDVVMTRATDMRARLAQRAFETWLVEQFRKNRGWDGVVSDLITATGDVREKGEVALIFAHNGDAKEIAAETSRIFLGIQIQCANCHDHPTDVWKREQFHALAAYFPRVAVRPVFDQMRIRSFEVVTAEYGRRGGFDPINLLRRYDKNRDGKLTADEVKGTPFERGFRFMLRQYDRNGDGAISKAEIEQGPRFGGFGRRRRAGAEYFMPDLKNPSSRGRRMDPAFFVGKVKSESGMKDIDRRKELAKLLTAKDNKWFSRAYVNRIWAEMLGEGFYMPIDDLGPTRKARFGKVLDVLADGFTASGYDVKWLFRTIANTQAYQRQIRAKDASDTSPPFASASPTRLRADQIYDSLTQALGSNEFRGNRFRFGRRRRFGGGGGMRYGRFNERFLFTQLFSFDPSTPQADIVGTVPQALYLMNSPRINNLIRGTGPTRLGNILRENSDDAKALSEVYLLVLSREPSAKERKICGDYIRKVRSRTEAFEDILWSLANSSEFLTKR